MLESSGAIHDLLAALAAPAAKEALLNARPAFLALAMLLAVLPANDAGAAGKRSFVAAQGADVGTCALLAPCRTLDYAIGQTLAGGEVIVLDSAGYGSVTITKAVTIAAPPGIYAGISATVSDGVTISAGTSDVVVLRGLTINGLGATFGILIHHAATVHVEQCTISGFPSGIQYNAGAGTALVIADSEFRGNGIGIQAAGSQANGRLEIARSRFHDNAQYGLYIQDVNRATIVDSFFGNNQFGVGVQTTANASANPSVALERTAIADSGDTGLVAASSVVLVSVVNVVNSTIAGNATGLHAFGGGYIRVAGTQIDGNGTGISTAGGSGFIVTLGTNLLHGNGVDGSFTGSLPQK